MVKFHGTLSDETVHFRYFGLALDRTMPLLADLGYDEARHNKMITQCAKPS
jgi:hypothetical protein